MSYKFEQFGIAFLAVLKVLSLCAFLDIFLYYYFAKGFINHFH